jgi:hypothetical protein
MKLEIIALPNCPDILILKYKHKNVNKKTTLPSRTYCYMISKPWTRLSLTFVIYYNDITGNRNDGKKVVDVVVVAAAVDVNDDEDDVDDMILMTH